MRSWTRPEIPRLPGRGPVPRLWNTATRSLEPSVVEDRRTVGRASLYVCGITPYDATHLGHAATYLAYDTLLRLWIDAGLDPVYVQNITDVDDPLLERAAATGVDWRELAAAQIELFRGDMRSLGVIPPDHYVAVTEAVDLVVDAVGRMLDSGTAYALGPDIYFDSAAAAIRSPWHLGQESGLPRDRMLELSAERGGDPATPGKRDPLDPVLWRGQRPGEPSWPGGDLGPGRPGWHIECSVIAQEHLELPIAVQGGGNDLVFPHHEFTAGHTAVLSGLDHARLYSHAGLVALDGQKMSKSLGNLVFVSALTADGVDPRAIRLAVLAHHYRDDWEWTADGLAEAHSRLARWEAKPAGSYTDRLRDILSNDLETPGALAFIDEQDGIDAPAIDALLGIRLRS